MDSVECQRCPQSRNKPVRGENNTTSLSLSLTPSLSYPLLVRVDAFLHRLPGKFMFNRVQNNEILLEEIRLEERITLAKRYLQIGNAAFAHQTLGLLAIEYRLLRACHILFATTALVERDIIWRTRFDAIHVTTAEGLHRFAAVGAKILRVAHIQRIIEVLQRFPVSLAARIVLCPILEDARLCA